ncbi:MAG TPA: hypothetical protein VJC39_03110 [Candidatus Nanoarchaeia archaeon]|nr:hypothetical protein [Candidatus Nanoarchaeia archaeon]
MEIKDVKANQGNVDLVIQVVSKENPRSFEKFGKQGTVCNVIVQDDTGKLKLTLWNDDIDKVNIGDKIHLKNGWCSEYKGEKQLSSGKLGSIEVLEKNASKLVTNDPKILNRMNGNNYSEDDSEGEEGEQEGEGDYIADEEMVED